MKTAVVIPAFNEGGGIRNVLLKAGDYADLVIVIDDGSVENKKVSVNDLNDKIICLKHRINLGKGATLKTGCEAALKLGADRMVLMDADGQHKPEDIPRLINKLENDNLDIVFGSRIIGRDMPLMMMLGNKFLSLATSLLFGIYISDTQSGFRAFKAAAYPKIKWNSTRYSVETEIIVNTGKKGLKFGEIEIQTIYHDKYKGTTIFDGIRIFINMLIWRII
jgi:glycosyltransferase involved in cell wall biosynthesis